MMKKKDKRLRTYGKGVCIPKYLWDMVDEEAKVSRRSVSMIIRIALEERYGINPYLYEEEK